MNCPFCNKSIDKHEAGTCMDAWIYCVIFKKKAVWSLRTDNIDWLYVGDMHFAVKPNRYKNKIIWCNSISLIPVKYSTSINLAMELWDSINKSSVHWMIKYGNLWQIDNKKSFKPVAKDSLLALAKCKAALVVNNI